MNWKIGTIPNKTETVMLATTSFFNYSNIYKVYYPLNLTSLLAKCFTLWPKLQKLFLTKERAEQIT